MKKDGPDSFKSWLIALSCFVINGVLFGLARLSGVLFVESMTRYNVGRTQASFPYTLASAVRNIASPFAGYVGHKIGVRATSTFGALLGALGIGLCYFAENILLVTILWGVVYGIGYCFANILLPVSINQYFDKHRATALGFSYSGGSVGAFILPSIVEIMLENYGLQKTFLLLSALVLICVPAALLLKKPNFKIESINVQKEKQGEKQHLLSGIKSTLYTAEKHPEKFDDFENTNPVKNNSLLNKEISRVEYTTALTHEKRIKKESNPTSLSDCSVDMSSSEPSDIDEIKDNINEKQRQKDDNISKEENVSSSSESTIKDDNTQNDDLDKGTKLLNVYIEEVELSFSSSSDTSNSRILCSKKKENIFSNYENINFKSNADEIYGNSLPRNNISVTSQSVDCSSQCIERQNSISKCYLHESADIIIRSQEEKENATHKVMNNNSDEKLHLAENKNQSCLGSFSVILEPIFILLAVSSAIKAFSYLCIVTIIVDFSRDLHIDTSNEKYILMLLSVGDIIGRLCLGWITDYGYMTRPTFVVICFACQALFTATIPLASDFTSLVVIVVLFGLSQAGILFIFPVIVGQYIDKDKQSIAIPSFHFLAGPLNLCASPLIGYFRDEIGAYDWMFYGIGILSAVASLLWIVASCILKRRKES